MKKCLEEDNASLISDPLFHRLFRLFLTFAEPVDTQQLFKPGISTKNRSLQHITAAQAHFIVNELFRLMRPRCSAQLQLPHHADQVTFRELVELCDLVFPDRKQLEPVVDRIFDRYVSQIVNKGFVMCRKVSPESKCSVRKKSHKWKSYWCTLVPGTVFLWPLHKKTTVSNRKSIILDENTVVHMGTFEEDRFTWQLYTSKHKYQFGHFDEIQRQHWIADTNLVVEYRNKSDLLNFDKEFSKRTENLGKYKDDTWRIALETENTRLTELLNEERQALCDEEIVRELATRMLDEEREKSELLEKQVIDLQAQIKRERTTCAQLELRLEEKMRIETTSNDQTELERLQMCMDSLDPYAENNNLDYLIVSTQSI